MLWQDAPSKKAVIGRYILPNKMSLAREVKFILLTLFNFYDYL